MTTVPPSDTPPSDTVSTETAPDAVPTMRVVAGNPTDEELAERLRQVADLVEEGYSEGIRSEWAWSRTG